MQIIISIVFSIGYVNIIINDIKEREKNTIELYASSIEYLANYENDIKIHCIRPATVCGYSPRMRLDVSVNMLTFQALKFKSMTVFGGNQIRPNIHIQDLVNVYKYFISNPNLLGGFYNAGFENLTILELAYKVKTVYAHLYKKDIKKTNSLNWWI